MDVKCLKAIARKLVETHAKKEISAGFKPAGLHPYYDEHGRLLYFKIRLKHPDGRKWIRPFHMDEQSHEYKMAEPETKIKPLYNLPLLINKKNNVIFVVEGELCCDKLNSLGVIATTSGGTTSIEKVSWLPLSGMTVYIWPDNDNKGLEYGLKVKEILTSLGCSVNFIDIHKLNLNESEDVVDWLKNNPHAKKDDILKLPLITQENSNSESDTKITINKISTLNAMEYEKERKTLAKSLGIRVSALDQHRKSSLNSTSTDYDIFSDHLEPWPNDINLAELLEELCSLIDSIMVFASKHEVIAISLYIIHTHCLTAAFCAPILNITSPEMQCGKTTLLSIINQLVYRPLSASNTSSAAAFRSIEKWTPTLIIDEGDTFLKTNEELRGIINSGHTRSSAFILRCVGDNHEPKRFSTWCSKVVAGIGRVAGTIHDRSITIRLRRKQAQEHKVRLRDIGNKTFEDIKRQIIKFSVDHINDLNGTQPQSPTTLSSRAADNWEPLLAIASIAGEDWLTKAKQAAIHLTSSRHDPLSTGIELLADIRKIFDEKGFIKIYSVELIDELCKIEESMWGIYNKGKPIHPRQLADLLKEYNICSKDIRIAPMMHVKKGYESEDFKQAFSLYLSTSRKIDANNATARHEPSLCSVVADSDDISEDTGRINNFSNVTFSSIDL